MKYHKVNLTGKKLICENTYQFTFDFTDIDYEFYPGHYAYFTIPENPEQQNKSDIPIQGNDIKGNSRPFSFAGSPNRKELIIAVRVNGSEFVDNILKLEPGSEMYISQPIGKNITEENFEKVFIAGGIGITPVRSLMEYYSENIPNEKITLLYFNKTRAQSAFLDEFDKWSEEIPGFKFVPFIEDESDKNWEYEYGLFSREVLNKYVNDLDEKKFYLFGSDLMDENVKRILIGSGVKEENIVTEEVN